MKIEKIKREEIETIAHICGNVFSHVMPYEANVAYTKATADWNISVKAVLEDGTIIGCYLLRESNMMKSEEGYENKRGLEGVALAILPEYRNLGYGKLLRDYPLSLNFDYIWGQHLKGLSNIDNWVKFGRRVLNDSPETQIYLTIMDIDRKQFKDYHQYQQTGYTCGPTSVQMVADFFGAEYNTINDIIKRCDCDNLKGTIDTGVKAGLDSLGIRNKQNKTFVRPLAMIELTQHVKFGKIFVMRTLTQGVKHWINIYGYDRDTEMFKVADPWLGLIEYDYDQIVSIWEPRDFDGFYILD